MSVEGFPMLSFLISSWGTGQYILICHFQSVTCPCNLGTHPFSVPQYCVRYPTPQWCEICSCQCQRPIWSVPSGSWFAPQEIFAENFTDLQDAVLRRGYYTYGGRNHDVCEFELRFDNGIVKGRGVDDVGLTSCGPTTTGKNSSWDRIIAVVAWAKPGNLMRALLPGPGAYTIRGKFDGRRHSIDFTKQCPLGSPWLAHVLHFVAHIGKLQSQHVRFRKMQW